MSSNLKVYRRYRHTMLLTLERAHGPCIFRHYAKTSTKSGFIQSPVSVTNTPDCPSTVIEGSAPGTRGAVIPSYTPQYDTTIPCLSSRVTLLNPSCMMGWFKAHTRPPLLSTTRVDSSISQGRLILVTICEADWCTRGSLDRQLMSDRQTAKDLESLEKLYKISLWFRSDAPEPLIGDQDCPHLAQTYGLLRRSCLTVFLDVQNDNNVKCRFERCFAFTFSTVDNALKHLREHHFGNRPFVCLSTNGVTW